MSEEVDKRRWDVVMGQIAANQHGVMTAEQLSRIGMSSTTVGERAAAGRLHRIHRGVYAVGHARLSERGRWMAAVLACGEGAVLSHLSALELWGIRRRPRRLSVAGEGGVEASHVTVPSTAGKRRQEGIVLHRSSTLTAADCTLRDGIPVTRPARTLADVRPLLSPAQFNSAMREAEYLRLPIGDPFTEADPSKRRERSGGRSLASPSDGRDRTRTHLEDRMLALCRRHRLPQPQVNVKVDRFEVDFLWQGQQVVVEVDGWESHRSRSAFEEDRKRDARLKLLGYEVLRFTWRQVDAAPRAVAEAVRALLRRDP